MDLVGGWRSKGRKLRDYSGTAVVSALSQWEVAMLAMKGRLSLAPDEESWFSANLESPGSLGIPLITADEKIIKWNEAQRLVQLIAL